MDLSDYLYLIIILGAALFQIVSKSLGNKSVKKVRDHEKNDESLKRIPKKENIVSDIPPEVVVTPAFKPEQQNSYVAVASNLADKSEQSEDLVISTETKPILSKNCFSSIEEVRKAIIYNEILNRKY